MDASLGTPVLGFGAAGPLENVPVIFLHGNNDTPFPTTCNPLYGKLHDFAASFLARGYSPSELWGLGYQATSVTSSRRRRTAPARRTRPRQTAPTYGG